MTQADWDGRRYVVSAATGVGDLSKFFDRQRQGLRDSESVLVGFDFPIGLPFAYFRQTSLTSFKDALLQFGGSGWARFYDLCEARAEISLQRPFYPRRSDRGTSPAHLVEALGLGDSTDLYRHCERTYPGRNAASPLFWTLGGKQVGRAAISGWRDLLAPALRIQQGALAIWPFDGSLTDLAGRFSIVVAETYPAEAYSHVGIARHGWNKRKQVDRREHAAKLRTWQENRAVFFAAAAETQLGDGFGPSKHGEDPFDAFVGLCAMIDVALGGRVSGEPPLESVRNVEGWILGQQFLG